MRIRDWSSDVCSSDLPSRSARRRRRVVPASAPPHVARARRHLHLQAFHRVGERDLAGEPAGARGADREIRSEEHTSELQSLMRISYPVFCLKNKNLLYNRQNTTQHYKIPNIRENNSYRT